jgi:nucleoside-diphosphate-sugar epimerase
MMRVLITGAGGFIGSHLVEDQLARGREVTAIDINVQALDFLKSNPKLHTLEADFANDSLVDPLLEGNEICFHLASAHLEKGVPDEYFWKVNVDETRRFVERNQRAGVNRFVHCSSVGVYGNIKNPPADEDSPCYPDIAYEKSKLAGEQAVLEYARQQEFPLVIVRPAWVYGPRCPRTAKLFNTIESGRFFFVGDGSTLRHPIYIDDMVAGFELAGTHQDALGEVLIMAGPSAVTIRELVNTIADVMGRPRPSLQLPRPLVYSGCLLLEGASALVGKEAPFSRRSMKFFEGNTAFSIEKAQRVIGFQATTELIEGLQKTYSWIQEDRKA